MDEQHPFQPGVKVAIATHDRHGDYRGIRVGVVFKVHKTGRFTLEEDSRRQYRVRQELKNPWRSRDAEATHIWRACPTKPSYNSPTIEVWSEAHDAELAAGDERVKQRNILSVLRASMDQFKPDGLPGTTEKLRDACALFKIDLPFLRI